MMMQVILKKLKKLLSCSLKIKKYNYEKKNVSSVILCFVIAFVFASCKKTRECECTHNLNGKISTKVHFYNETKKNAETECDLNEIEYDGATWDCELVK